MCIICTKDMKSIKSAKLHLITSTVKFHTQFKEKTIVPNPSDIILNYISCVILLSPNNMYVICTNNMYVICTQIICMLFV